MAVEIGGKISKGEEAAKKEIARDSERERERERGEGEG